MSILQKAFRVDSDIKEIFHEKRPIACYKRTWILPNGQPVWYEFRPEGAEPQYLKVSEVVVTYNH